MPEPPRLKPRELQVLRLLADGMSDRDIAASLDLAPETVRWYNKELYLKLGVSSRTQAVRRATALGLLDLPVADSPRTTVSARPRARGRAEGVARTPVRFVERDGVFIAYQVVGSGPVDLLFVNGFVSHLEAAWEDPEYAAFFEQLGSVARVILFDKRGVGLSDRVPGAPTLEETTGDACAVLDAVRATRVYVMGTSEGGAASVMLALQSPERVRGLILCNATARVARPGNDPPWAVPVHEFNHRMRLITEQWGTPWALARFAPSRMHDQRFADWWSRVLRSAASPSSVRAVMEVARDVDIRQLLPQLRTRTLVLHRTDDQVVSIGAGRYLAERIPHARFIELPGGDHLFFVNGEAVLRAVAEFLAMPDADPAATPGHEAMPETWLAVILQLRGRAMLVGAETRAVLERGRGHFVREVPGGWSALFDTPSRAIACARLLREASAANHRGAPGAVALHIGECRTNDGVPVGLARAVVQQLSELAAPGDVVLSDTLRDIIVGSGVSLDRFVVAPVPGGDGTPYGWCLAD